MYNKMMCKVVEILDNDETLDRFKGFVRFNNNWITKHQKNLFNKDGIKYEVLGFFEIERGDGKYSCLQFKENIQIGDVFFLNKSDTGKCIEPNCTKNATKDYNGHKHFVCDDCYDSLTRYFEEEYD